MSTLTCGTCPDYMQGACMHPCARLNPADNDNSATSAYGFYSRFRAERRLIEQWAKRVRRFTQTPPDSLIDNDLRFMAYTYGCIEDRGIVMW